MKEYPCASSLSLISFQSLGWTRRSQLLKSKESCKDHYHPRDILLKSSSLLHTLNKGYRTVFSLLLTNIGRFLWIHSLFSAGTLQSNTMPGQFRKSLGLAVRLTTTVLATCLWDSLHPSRKTGIFASHLMRTKSLPSEHYEWTYCSLWQTVHTQPPRSKAATGVAPFTSSSVSSQLNSLPLALGRLRVGVPVSQADVLALYDLASALHGAIHTLVRETWR